MTHAEEISDALKDSLSILKENKNAKEFRQLMHLDPNESEGKEEIEKVNNAMSQVNFKHLSKSEARNLPYQEIAHNYCKHSLPCNSLKHSKAGCFFAACNLANVLS